MIEVKDLYYTYPGNNESTIKGLNFVIGKGEIFGFLGPSGAGKSTTQKIIIGTLKNYLGQIIVMNRELSKYQNDYYEKIGVSFEFPNLYTKFSAFENLSYFGSLYTGPTEDPLQLLQRVGLENDAHSQVAGFSKGMKMRLNFCRALLHRPEILFLDEPTSGLDPVNARIIKEMILEKKAEGKTVFLTTHNMQVAEEICDRVAFIIDGQIRLIDSPHELKLREGKKSVRIEFIENNHISVKDFPLAGIGRDPSFLDIIQNKEIRTIHTQEATLEDIFIKATGRSLT